MVSVPRSARRRILAISATAAAAATLGLPALASAHIHASPDEVEAGKSVTAEFGLPHGCDGSPTTKITFEIPEQFASATATRNANWDLTTTKDGDRTTSITYTAKDPLPADQRDAFAITLKAAKDAQPGTVAVPTTQVCEKGQIEWNATDANADHPAPSITILAAGSESTTAAAPAEATTNASAAESSAAESSNVAAYWGLGLGIVGTILGIVALLLAAKRR